MKILIVVDMQNDFITGSLGTEEARAIVPNVKKKVEEAVANGDYIVYTRDTHPIRYLKTKEGEKLPVEHCIEGTDGWQIPDELMPPKDYENCRFHDKYTFGSVKLPAELFKDLQAEFITKQITEIELIGVCTDICVVSNALLMKANYFEMTDISVDSTCCAGVTPESHEAALKVMEMCHINVKRG